MRLLDQHRFADAASAYTRAVERNPRDAKSYYKRAVANAMVDRQDAIGAAFESWRAKIRSGNRR